jgi:hypothetical protein
MRAAIVIDGLLPDAFSLVQVATHHRDSNALVQGRTVQGQHASLAVAIHANGSMVLFPGEPVHSGEDLLYLVANDMPAHLIGHPVDELALGLVGHPAQGGIA